MEILSPVPMPDPVRSYYRAALSGLRHIEARRPSGRRFGENADALWRSFAGELTTSDRIDLLIRDADAEWPGAFGARTVFARAGVAEDEAFGVGWYPLDPPDAEELWREVTRSDAPADVSSALVSAAASWGVTLSAFELGEINASEKVLVAGPSAIAAVIARFSDYRGLGWGEQVAVVATPECHRQLALLGAALVNVNKPTRVLPATEFEQQRPSARRVLVSPDADPRDRAVAEGAQE
jgi:hypothetical protein